MDKPFMGQWDWLPIIICMACICVWISGCTLLNASGTSVEPTPKPSDAPKVTLTVQAAISSTPPPTRIAAVMPPMSMNAQPNPTPSIYVVKENDTLLDIALQFGVTVEQIQAANPTIDPRALQIGQSLVIPQDENAAPTLSGANIPPPLALVPPNCQPTTTNSVLCLGMVENNQAQPVEQVQVAIQLLGADGLVIEEQLVSVAQSYLLPNQLAPYGVLLPNIAESDFGGAVAALMSAELTDNIEARYVQPTLENERASISGRRYLLEFDLINPADTPILPRAVISLVDDQSILYAYRVWEVDTPLGAGERTAVRMALLPSGLDGAPPTALRHLLHVEARALN